MVQAAGQALQMQARKEMEESRGSREVVRRPPHITALEVTPLQKGPQQQELKTYSRPRLGLEP